jgi:hypothetical protein
MKKTNLWWHTNSDWASLIRPTIRSNAAWRIRSSCFLRSSSSRASSARTSCSSPFPIVPSEVAGTLSSLAASSPTQCLKLFLFPTKQKTTKFFILNKDILKLIPIVDWLPAARSFCSSSLSWVNEASFSPVSSEYFWISKKKNAKFFLWIKLFLN